MKRSSSSSTLCRGAQPRGSRVPLQYQEAGRQERVILRGPGTNRNPPSIISTVWAQSSLHPFISYLAMRSQRRQRGVMSRVSPHDARSLVPTQNQPAEKARLTNTTRLAGLLSGYIRER